MNFINELNTVCTRVLTSLNIEIITPPTEFTTLCIPLNIELNNEPTELIMGGNVFPKAFIIFVTPSNITSNVFINVGPTVCMNFPQASSIVGNVSFTTNNIAEIDVTNANIPNNANGLEVNNIAIADIAVMAATTVKNTEDNRPATSATFIPVLLNVSNNFVT